ncbi:MAG: phospholipase D-like domain-containing protein [Bryobacteraceae bacterium]
MSDLPGTGHISESRRWLQPRVPRERLHRMAPARPPRQRIGVRAISDRMRFWIRTWWAWAAVAAACLTWGFWPFAIPAGLVALIFYHTTPSYHPAAFPIDTPLTTGSPEFIRTMEGITGTSVVEGNVVRLFNNGDEFYPAMLEAIESAAHSITLEQYIFWDGRVADRFSEAFAEQARRGVSVKLLVDGIGSASLSGRTLGVLEAAGVQLAWYRPVRWYTLDRANFRTHRKTLVVDGRIAFSGGAGIADQWLGNARDASEWRDMAIAIEGPAAVALQAGFAQNWLITTGEMITGRRFFPLPEPAGDVRVQTILSSPSSGAAAAGTMYLLALQCAERSLWIANPYFIPNAGVIELLARACRRGVEVKLMVAGGKSDTWWARQNSNRLYGRLLEAGVEIHEFAPTMLHQKTMVVDDRWGTVGTTNFDNRSFALSEESNVCFHNPALVAQLRETFLADLERCQRIRLETWRRRGPWNRIQEQVASLIEDQV